MVRLSPLDATLSELSGICCIQRTREMIQRDVNRLFRANFEKWTGQQNTD